MPDIRCVCLSDTHFGARGSLLTHLDATTLETAPEVPSIVLQRLATCLRALCGRNEGTTKPTLLLCGDILEMALNTEDQAIMAFERFVEETMPPGGELFSAIRYIPGNHDHHLWETAREFQYAENYLGDMRPGARLEIPWHATKMFDPNSLCTCLLTAIVKRFTHLAGMQIETSYPNFGIVTEDRRRCVAISHGHFIEPMYSLMSFVRALIFPHRPAPEFVWDLEAENFAWIDFFWSTLGRSGDIGRSVGLIYDKLQDSSQVDRMVSNLAEGLARRSDLPGWGDWMEAALLRKVLGHLVRNVSWLERGRDRESLTRVAHQGLMEYVGGPVRRQIEVERGGLPDLVSFVFGHTHKPFQQRMSIQPFNEDLRVYNTGGWVVDKLEPQPLYGGAAVLIDENLNVASLKFYNEGDPVDGPGPRVESLDESLFSARIRTLCAERPKPWQDLAASIPPEVHLRIASLRKAIQSN